MMAKSKVRKIKPPKDPLRLTHRTVRGNLGWAIPSAVGLAFAAWLAYRFAEFQRAAEVVAEPEDLKSNALIFNGIVIAVLVVTLLVSLSGLSSVWRSWRRGRRSFSKFERRIVDHRMAQRHWWIVAGTTRESIASDGMKLIEPPRELIALPDEKFYLNGTMGYSRWYGTDAVMHLPGTIISSNPWLMIGGAIGAAAGRRRARAQAAAISQAQWREWQGAPVVVTNRRILCFVAQHGWLSFYYGGVTSFYPDVENWTFVIDYDDTPALRLQGYLAPAAAVAVSNHLRGTDATLADPDLAKIMRIPHDHWLDPHGLGEQQPLAALAD